MLIGGEDQSDYHHMIAAFLKLTVSNCKFPPNYQLIEAEGGKQTVS